MCTYICVYFIYIVQVFCAELPIFLREHRNGMYRTDVYFLCKTLAEAPIFIAVPLLFTIIAYPMIGLYPGIDHFFITAGIVALVANVSTSFGMLFIIYIMNNFSINHTYIYSIEKYFFYRLSNILHQQQFIHGVIHRATSDNTVFAFWWIFLKYGVNIITIGIYLILIIYTDAEHYLYMYNLYVIIYRSVPFYFEWFSYLSWFRYGNEALLINQWSEVESIACTRSNATCPKSGRMILQTFNFKQVRDIIHVYIFMILYPFQRGKRDYISLRIHVRFI